MSALRHFIKDSSHLILNVLFPPKCLLCHAFIPEVGACCADCWQHIDFNSHPCCAICSYPFEYDMGEDALCATCISHPPPYQKARAVFRYNDHSKTLIHNFKYKDRVHAAPYFAKWMVRSSSELLKNADMLVPVPLHRYRLMRRYYNQSALLANELGKLCAIPVAPQLLIRTKHTAPQHRLTDSQRQKNVHGAFKLHPRFDNIAGKKILLIDDVMTTGSTLNACSRILTKAGAEVTLLTLARTIKE